MADFMDDFLDTVFGGGSAKAVPKRVQAPPQASPRAPANRSGPSAKVWLEGELICCQSPYNADSIADMRNVWGRRWDPTRKINTFPLSSRPAFETWAGKWFPGTDLSPLRGATAIPKIEIVVSNGFLRVKTPYSEDFVASVKRMPTVTYSKEDRLWIVPLDRAKVLAEHIRYCYRVDTPPVLAEVIAEQERMRSLATAVRSDDQIILEGGELFPYQVAGVRFLNEKGKGLVADEMGLGKSIQAITYIYKNKEACLPCVVVCPARLKINWEREVRKWLGDELTVTIHGAKPKRKRGKDAVLITGPDTVADVTIVNYETAGKLLDGETKKALLPFKSMIVDEAHNVKNPKAQRSVAIAHLAESVNGRVVFLSGTPMLNRPEELWNLLRMMDAETWGSLSKFKWRYCGPQRTHWGVEYSGSSNIAELHDRLLGHYMVRRLKKDVLKELPDKIRSYVPVELSGEGTKAYLSSLTEITAKAEEAAAKLEKISYANVLAMMTALRHAVGLQKVPLAVAWVQEALENTDKVLVFAHHHDVIDGIVEGMREVGIRVGVIDGRETMKSGQAAVDGFQAGDTQVLVCGIMAAGVGLTLTAADQVLFVERVWRPSDHSQAEDRAHRIGQKRCVNVWFLDAVGTIDEDLRELQDSKKSVISQTVDGKVVDADSQEKAVVLEVARRILRGANVEER